LGRLFKKEYVTMKEFRKAVRLAAVTLAAVTLAACASKDVKKADISSTAVPSDEIARLEADINAGYGEQYDVLDDADFTKAQSWLKEAKDDLRDGKKQSEILDDVAYGRGFLQRTQELADGRKAQFQGILDARQAAVEAGARNTSTEKTTMRELDDRFRRVAAHRDVSAEYFNDLQRDYMRLETHAIQMTQLGNARARIDGAEAANAKRYVPNVLKEARVDLVNADNMIAANRHNPDGYQEAVAKANASSQLLVDTLKQADNGRVAESAALDLVLSQRKIDRLQSQLGQSEEQQKALNQKYSQTNAKLSEAEKAKALDDVLANAKKEFSKDEAEVYRDGDKLLIRLKAMNFPTGRSELPTTSLPLLAKVKGIAEDLKPQQILIEGHTDSTGNRAQNLELSQNRAEAVAQYFESNGVDSNTISAVGQGYKAPIASNKTKAGRAQNRRVDVIIVPAGAQQNQPQAQPQAE
jgi:outer membrane protein OmpA-like peptidoglycan-associated protein